MSLLGDALTIIGQLERESRSHNNMKPSTLQKIYKEWKLRLKPVDPSLLKKGYCDGCMVEAKLVYVTRWGSDLCPECRPWFWNELQ